VLEIDRLGARLDDLQRKSDALRVTLPAVDPALGNAAPGGFEVPVAIRSAWEASLVVLTGVASAVVFLWWLWPIAAVVVWLVRRSSRSLAKRPVVQG
jgi:hypothetical protein